MPAPRPLQSVEQLFAQHSSMPLPMATPFGYFASHAEMHWSKVWPPLVPLVPLVPLAPLEVVPPLDADVPELEVPGLPEELAVDEVPPSPASGPGSLPEQPAKSEAPPIARPTTSAEAWATELGITSFILAAHVGPKSWHFVGTCAAVQLPIGTLAAPGSAAMFAISNDRASSLIWPDRFDYANPGLR